MSGGSDVELLISSELFYRGEDLWDLLESSESQESVESVDSEYFSLATGFRDKASPPLFSFPCLYSNLY